MTTFETQELKTLLIDRGVRFSGVETNINSSDDFWATTIELLIGEMPKNEEVLEIGSKISSEIQESLRRSIGNNYINEVKKIGVFHNRYIVVFLKNGEQKIYDIAKLGENGFVIEGGLEALIQESVEKFTLNWGGFQDHLNAMQVLFEKNHEVGISGGYLDEADILHAHIIDDRIAESLRGQNIYQIQQEARKKYRELVYIMGELPINSLPEEHRNVITESIDTYTRMVMGVGDMYEGGATLFDKSESEVAYGIDFVVNSKNSTSEIFTYWHSVRNAMDNNNSQDTTVENMSYPFYMKSVNRLCYTRLLALGATQEELHTFARIISGRDLDGGNYGPNNYDPEFANQILGTLIGMPSQESNRQVNSSSESIIEKLINHEIMSDVQDREVLFPDDLSLLTDKAKTICERAGLAFPHFMNTSFPGKLISNLSGKYTDLDLGEKVRISAISRFITYLESSLQETPNEDEYNTALKNNAENVYQSFQQGMFLGPFTYMHYESGSNYYEVSTNNSYDGERVTLKIPISQVQDQSMLYLCIHQFSTLMLRGDIYYDSDSGNYRNAEEEALSEPQLFELIGIKPYGTDKYNLLPVPAPNLTPEYISRIQQLSVSEAFDHVSENIMGKFDWYNHGEENEFISVHNLHSIRKDGQRLLSDTEIDILKTWTEINGLGGAFATSDATKEKLMQGAKIALIIALSMAATYATAGLATYAGAAAMGNLIRGGTLIGQMVQGGVMGAYAAPISWGVYPHGYSSREEMIVDLLSDVGVSTLTGIAGGAFSAKFTGPQTGVGRNLAVNGIDFAVLGLLTEAKRMQVIQEIYHPGENFLDQNEL